MTGHRALSFALLLSLSACRRGEPHREVIEPTKGQPNEVTCQRPDLVRTYGLPVDLAGTCVDASVDVRQYGAGAPQHLDVICSEFFHSECELFKSFGLLNVSTLEYAERSGTSRLLLRVSEFEKIKGAFGFYSRRSVGESTPAEVQVCGLSVDAWAATGQGKLYLMKGRRVFEASYLNERETPAEQTEHAERLLSAFAKELAGQIDGELKLPKEAEILVRLGVQPFDIRVAEDEILGVFGFGQHYLGFVEREGHSYLVHLSDQRDEDRAKDAYLRLKSQRLGKDQREKTILRVRHTEEGKDPITAFFTRRGSYLLGVTPLEATPDHDDVALSVLDGLLKNWQRP